MHATGTVRDGVVVPDNASDLPDGARVVIELLDEAHTGTTVGARLMRFAGRAHGLPCDMAENHDHYLHGKPRR